MSVKVLWAHPDHWNQLLSQAWHTVLEFVRAISLVSAVILAQANMPKKKVRHLLEAAAWARDALYTLVGHSPQAVRAVQIASSSSRRAPFLQSSGARLPHQLYKTPVGQATWEANNCIVWRYLQLRAQDPGAAERFLSRLFHVEAAFTITLADDVTGRALTN